MSWKRIPRTVQIKLRLDTTVLPWLPVKLRQRWVPPPIYYDSKLIRRRIDGVLWKLDPSQTVDRNILTADCADGIAHAAKAISRSKNKVVLDIGANLGQFCLPLAEFARKANWQAKIFAFEPNPVVNAKLCSNQELNPSLAAYVKSFCCGMSEKPGSLSLTVPTRSSGLGSFARHYQNEEHQVLEVPVNTIDRFVQERELPGVDFIKIDVEGFEYQVLSGAIETLSRYGPSLFVEMLDVDSQAGQLLTSLGYQPYRILKQDIFWTRR